jgi:hypothetical protein
VSGSAVPGDALSAFGGTVSAEASMTGNRVFVGVTKLGTPFGNGVSTPRATIVRLSFRVLKAGSTTLSFDGSVSPQDPAGIPEALDSTGNVVASIVFDAAPASITGR